MTDLLEMRGMQLRYGAVQALAGVDLDVRGGEVHALLGENGAGKSSLMQVLVGAVRPDAGTMRLSGAIHAPSSTAAALANGVAMVFQELTVLPHLTVVENLWLGRERTRGPLVDRRRQRDRAEAVLTRLGRSELRPDQRVSTLAPADRQMVEIARAVLAEARVLVLDEPTSSLGATDVERLFAVLDQLRRAGLGIVYISHALEEVRAICDRCTVLRDGKHVASGPLLELDDRSLVRHMAGRPLDEVFPARREHIGEVVLEVRDLAADPLPVRVAFELRAGEIAGIAGLAGAGRTETLQAIFGTRPRRAGAVLLRGDDAVLLRGNPREAWRRRVGMLAEDRKNEGLSQSMPIASNIVLPRLAPYARAGLLRWAAALRAATGFGQRVNLRCQSVRQPVSQLSGGNQQKVAIARLLHADCRVLLLDEPTRGIDVGSRQEVYRLLDAAARDGLAVLVVSSHLPELLGLCDRIAVMQKGVLGAFRPTGAWTQEELLHEAIGGERLAEVSA